MRDDRLPRAEAGNVLCHFGLPGLGAAPSAGAHDAPMQQLSALSVVGMLAAGGAA